MSPQRKTISARYNCGSPFWDLRSLLAAKLGRCARCMKQTFSVAVVLWLVVIGIRPGALALLYPVVAAAAALSLLWLLHVIAFTRYAVRSARIANRLRGAQQPPSNLLLALIKAIAASVVASVPGLGFLQARGMPACNCYFHGDCTVYIVSGAFKWCNYSDPCYWVQKGEEDCRRHREVPGGCDGTCQWFGHLWANVDVTQVIRTLELYFNAFHHAATHLAGPAQPGVPNQEFLAEARRTKLPAGWHDELQAFVFSALDLTLGRDFELGQRGECDSRDRHVRAFLAHIEDERAMPELITAARDAFVSAVSENDVSEVEAPLRRFWEKFPSYVPAHGGRCYPHGHDEYEHAIECQIAHFRSMLSALLSTRQELSSA